MIDKVYLAKTMTSTLCWVLAMCFILGFLQQPGKINTEIKFPFQIKKWSLIYRKWCAGLYSLWLSSAHCFAPKSLCCSSYILLCIYSPQRHLLASLGHTKIHANRKAMFSSKAITWILKMTSTIMVSSTLTTTLIIMKTDHLSLLGQNYSL